MTNVGCVFTIGLRNQLIAAAFARNLLLRFSRGDVHTKKARALSSTLKEVKVEKLPL